MNTISTSSQTFTRKHIDLVSIITPSYNRDWIIEQCINSIKIQSYANLEHIVVDGGSVDNTIQILKNEEKNYNLRWICEQDDGIYDAINKGISLAKGDILAYLNTDDFYFPYTVETVVKVFNNSDAEIVYGDWLNLYYWSGRFDLLPWINLNKYDLLSGCNLPQPTVFIRRKVFDEIGVFNLNYRLMADNEFFTKAALAGFKIVKINEFIAGQTIHENNSLAGNEKAKLIANQEGLKYRKHYQEIYKIPSLYLLVVKLKNIFAFRLIANYKILKFIFCYLLSCRHESWNNFRCYLKNRNASIDKLKLIKYLMNGLVNKKVSNKNDLAFLYFENKE